MLESNLVDKHFDGE